MIKPQPLHLLWAASALMLFPPTLVTLATAGNPSVRYVTSPFRNFFWVENKTISSSDADLVMATKNGCQCRMMCFSSTACMMWSFVWVNQSTAECRMSYLGPMNSNLLEQGNTSLFFKEASVEGEYFFMPDGLLYLKPLGITLTYADAKAYCSRIPGHRLNIYKWKAQWEAIYKKMDSNFPSWVFDLKKQSDGSAIWGDGTLYNDTELAQTQNLVNTDDTSTIYILYAGKICNGVTDRQRRFFCQANPGGVEW